MDFFKCQLRETKKVRKGETRQVEVYPEFQVLKSEDLMCRGGKFAAVWDEARGLWSTSEYDVQSLVDKELYAYAKQLAEDEDLDVRVASMRGMSSGSWQNFKKYLQNLPDSFHELDKKLIFSNTETTKKDYATKKLSYPLAQCDIPAWSRIVSTLYSPEERQKIEWAIGAIVSGEAQSIQKFLVLYGESGTGKSTILNIIQKLFQGYFTTFESKALGMTNNTFATEAFRTNPLVAIEHDGDLSRIEDNTKLNSLVAHEEMVMNEKFKSSYTSRSNAFIFMGTNKPVKITDAKSGIIRRLIDVRPCGGHIPQEEYWQLMSQVEFELGGIAWHCLQVFNKMTKNYYSGYKPLEMILQTDVFYNFVEQYFYDFVKDDMITLNRAWDLYKDYCEEALIEHKLPRHKFREELRNYFRKFTEHTKVDGVFVRSLYSEFITDKFRSIKEEAIGTVEIVLDKTKSLLDKEWNGCLAQYGNRTTANLPEKRWVNVETHLSDLDTTQLHYVQPPDNHIVIDLDIRGENGEKSRELNSKEAAKWPPTYAEYSKSGAGIHLHYIYDGDTHKLSGIYSDGIEVKVFHGDASLRRKLSYCNDLPIAHINSGLPLKGDKMINEEVVKTEKGLRTLILRNLKKEYMHFTRPSIDFIKKILDDAYSSGLHYDLTSLESSVLMFATQSTNQADYCVKQVAEMKFKSEDPISEDSPQSYEDDSRIVFYDVETFPNLFYISWKYKGVDMPCVRMFNPKPADIENLMKMKLVGFNNRRYDNHMVYGAYMGLDNEGLFRLSDGMINGNHQGYREAYNISYTDVYDFASAANKKSLKAWEIELGIHHQELGLPWNKPVPEELWDKVAAYCDNDVIATEVVYDHLSGDWEARKILSEISGLSVNTSTNQHSIKILFDGEKNPQKDFIYTDLSEMFPGYKFDAGKSKYRGEEVGEGGYVYAEPGIYENVALLDVASMHPSSIEALNLFGPYTKRFSDLKKGRIAIKHKDTDSLMTLLDGKLKPVIERAKSGAFTFKDLSNGLKTVLNSVYGLTFASFDNPCRDKRNKDNIVAKRGALFMVDLKYAVQEKGFTVAHIKTDSIKIPNATQEIIDFVFEFGKKYGYTFEHEATYSKFCLVNDAVYIAKDKDGWHATGAEFAQPYVYKSLFSQEEITFNDLCETKSVSSPAAIYLDMNESLGSTEEYEKEMIRREKNEKGNSKFQYMSDDDIKGLIAKGHNYQFVGKIGSFCPIEPGGGGGIMLRGKDDRYTSVTGTKDYRWLEAETVKTLNLYDKIDTTYHENLVEKAIKHISAFGDFNKFVSPDNSS